MCVPPRGADDAGKCAARACGGGLEYAHEDSPMIQISESAQPGMHRKLIAVVEIAR